MKDTNDWYSDSKFDYTYNGRYWAAHSGPDSDDFTILFGYSNNGISIMPSFNYERHSLTHPFALLNQKANTIVGDKLFGELFLVEDRQIYIGVILPAETKLEFRLDMRYFYKNIRFGFVYEYEFIVDYIFNGHDTPSGQKSSGVIMLSVEKNF